jgi:hypothetical protein
VLACGNSREEAIERAKALSLRLLAYRLECGEDIPEMGGVFAVLRESLASDQGETSSPTTSDRPASECTIGFG